MTQVPDEVRRAEAEIDTAIRALPVWQATRDELLRAILDLYRDSIEMVLMEVGRQRVMAEHFGQNKADVRPALQMEGQLHLGIYWALKWALAWCPTRGAAPPAPTSLLELVWVGAAYQALADGLWMHKQGWGRVVADLHAKTLVLHEGGDRTGRDAELAEYLHGFLAIHRHKSFTEDTDSLTRRWTAGDFRHLGAALRTACAEACQESVVFGVTEPPTELFKRPVVLEVPEQIAERYAALLADLALSQDAVAESGGLWRHNNWFDTPFLAIGGRYLCPSNILEAVFQDGVDEHMLRAAARVDPNQYPRVSQAREERMSSFCVGELEAQGWTCTAPLALHDPPADVDIYATRANDRLALELKSTLRPESPREVASRNDEIHHGLRRSEERLRQLPAGTIGAVVTDGYHGDYRTWADALKRRIPVLTTAELGAFAKQPNATADALASWAATEPAGSNPLPDRETTLMGWTLLARDTA